MDRSHGLPPDVESMVANYSHELVFWLNGRKVVVCDPDPSTMLTDYLRNLGLTGTKVGCARAVRRVHRDAFYAEFRGATTSRASMPAYAHYGLGRHPHHYGRRNR